ncbi:hypothetical protein GMOD_00006952 [Pyrenophora seminiperda CCB06]|uniref:Uncharacterized protein n=1 Tax=Pyrenophora seminiperda CCB06 TaxID=1302712 RepID=A0A3M7MBY9_9PLEO|nr:hypothetical protein GMOD_00006952 [Pyrenophora seminiperda CCB06]
MFSTPETAEMRPLTAHPNTAWGEPLYRASNKPHAALMSVAVVKSDRVLRWRLMRYRKEEFANGEYVFEGSTGKVTSTTLDNSDFQNCRASSLLLANI